LKKICKINLKSQCWKYLLFNVYWISIEGENQINFAPKAKIPCSALRQGKLKSQFCWEDSPLARSYSDEDFGIGPPVEAMAYNPVRRPTRNKYIPTNQIKIVAKKPCWENSATARAYSDESSQVWTFLNL
jgi:hypothetical protein